MIRYSIGVLGLCLGIWCAEIALDQPQGLLALAAAQWGVLCFCFGLLYIHKAIVATFGPVDWNVLLDGLLEKD